MATRGAARLGADRPGLSTVDRGAAARYVLGRRTPDGGFSFYRTPSWGVEEPSAPDTLAALESLRLASVEVPEPQETVRWLRSLQGPDGGFSTLTIGWAALRSLHVLRAAPWSPPARWLEHVAGLAGRPGLDRSWRGALADASHVLELLELGEPGAAATPAVGSWVARLLDEAADPGGGWARPGSDLETVAVAARLARLARLDGGSQDEASRYVRRCEDPTFGLRLGPDAATTSVGALRGGLWLLQSGGLAGGHLDAVGRQLVMLQGPDGGFAARHRALSTLQDTWRGLDAARLLDELQEA